MHLLILLLAIVGNTDAKPCPVQIIEARQTPLKDKYAVFIKFKNTGDKTIKAAAFFMDMIDAVNDAHPYPEKLTTTKTLRPGKDEKAYFIVHADLHSEAHNGIKAYPYKVVFDDGSDMVCK